MPKYLLIASEVVPVYSGEERSFPKLHWFETDASLTSFLDTWGKNMVDPIIYELAGRIQAKQVTKLELTRS